MDDGLRPDPRPDGARRGRRDPAADAGRQGDDGFFIAHKISKFWLRFSTLVRTYNLHRLLPLLPGVRQDKKHDHTLIVNPKVAAFLTDKIFHLFGYRKKVLRDHKLHFIKRDRKITPFI